MFSAKAKVCGIIANPVEHSMSPLLHSSISENMGVDFAYIPLKVEKDLQKAIEGAYHLSFSGMNVSVPYKQEVISYIKDIDEVAKAIGAVNTLIRDEKLLGYKGYNTDMAGLEKAILDNNIEIKDKDVVILACGGAAKAVIYLCLKSKVRSIRIFNRSIEKAQKIVKDLKTSFLAFNKNEVLPEIDVYSLEDIDKVLTIKNYIVFQTSNVGMYPNNEDILVKSAKFYDKALLGIDLIYTPSTTAFMKEFIKRDKPAFNGLDMLINQGIISWELWNNLKVDEDTRKKAKKEIESFLRKA